MINYFNGLKPKIVLSAICLLNLSFVFSQQKTLKDFFLPFESKAPLVSKGVWGDKNVIPRDTTNGLEDTSLKKWCYWDGGIVKDDDGKYHMYASRWSQSFHHGYGWNNDSKGIHSVSDNLFGPYKDLGLTWPKWNKGSGHNVIGLRMHDGRYAIVTSEVVPGQVFVSDNPNGPFDLLGAFKIDTNGYYAGWGRYNELDDGALKAGVVGNLANVMIILRPDGKYMMIARHCVAMISDNGILGPYKMLSDKAWLGVKDLPQFKMEDPTVWYSNNMYHIVVNHYGGSHDNTYHLTSEDGIHNWKNRGKVFDRESSIFKHKNGTIEDWRTVQRPTVYTENGVVKSFNFSVIDVHKGEDDGNDKSGSKVIVVPFDGESFGTHIQSIVDAENKKADSTLPPSLWKSIDIGSMSQKGNTGFDKDVNTIRVQSSGNSIDAKNDAFRFVYQKMSGDISISTMVMSHDISGGPVKAGLMIRENLKTDAPFVMISIQKNKGLQLEQRGEAAATPRVLKSLNIEAPYWIRIEKRGNVMTSFVSSSNRLNWKKIGENKIDFEEEFYVGMMATSTNETKNSLARFKDVDAHSYGKPVKDGIVNHTFPDSIPASGIVDFEVELESVQTLDVWVELQNVQTLEKYKVLRERFWKNGKKKLTYNAGKQLDANAAYWFVIKAVPMHFHDSEHIQAVFKKVFINKRE